MCLLILLASLYRASNLRRTRCLLIQLTLVGALASRVPLLLPVPVCRPNRLASSLFLVLSRE